MTDDDFRIPDWLIRNNNTEGNKMNVAPKIEPSTITIKDLRPGTEHPHGNVNSRMEYTRAQIDSRKESIMSFGVIASLLVVPHPNKSGTPYFVAAGGLRRIAIEELVKEKRLPADFPIPIIVKDNWDTAMALAASIEENRSPVPPHPVEVYEQFADLATRGKTVEDIATLYGMKKKDVEGVLALGGLHPELRRLWKDGKLTAEIAKEFTLETDMKRQLAIYKKVDSKNGGIWAGEVREAILGESDGAAKYVNFIGIDAYEAAGGKVIKDLFEEKHGVSDAALAKRLADEKLDFTRKDLEADGWSWTALEDEVSNMWRHTWPRIKVTPNFSKTEKTRQAEIEKQFDRLRELDDIATGLSDVQQQEWDLLEAERDGIKQTAELREYTAKQKAKSGVIISLKDDGALEMAFAVIKPATAKETSNKEMDFPSQQAKKKASKSAGLSNALAQRLSEALTIATGKQLAMEPAVAVPALIAGFCATAESPVKVSEEGMSVPSKKSTYKSTPFLTSFETVKKTPLAKQAEALAAIAADAISFRVLTSDRKPLANKDVAAICTALNGKQLNAEIRAAFDAKDYFDGISSTMRVAAIKEACGEDPAARASKLKKAEQTKFAVDNVPKTGWLPVELRTSHYDGPGAKAAAKAKKGK